MLRTAGGARAKLALGARGIAYINVKFNVKVRPRLNGQYLNRIPKKSLSFHQHVGFIFVNHGARDPAQALECVLSDALVLVGSQRRLHASPNAIFKKCKGPGTEHAC